ncbi:MAG: Fpg/Nei family DNA glycosylase [Burkholderiales bacterium]|nr:Fpg/Nei family DNA glycosylase [Opitutaceae bacterium]
MPELAEVAYIRRRWNPGLGRTVATVRLHPRAGVFKTTDPALLARHLPGARLDSSEAAAKQMLFRLTTADRAQTPLWLGIHLGMTGELLVRPHGLPDQKADHLILDQPSAPGDAQPGQSLVFSDFRMFGRVQFHVGPDAPVWWAGIAPAVTSPAFTVAAVSDFLRRRARAPIKAVLLMQERFPGVGNWMADEILWRAAIHPARRCGDLTPAEVKKLHKETVWVCEQSLRLIGEADTPEWPDPPATWLFQHRWEEGGLCPRTRTPLERATIGGRTTCWSPSRQKLPPG